MPALDPGEIATELRTSEIQLWSSQYRKASKAGRRLPHRSVFFFPIPSDRAKRYLFCPREKLG
jgi:hypothetical protein